MQSMRLQHTNQVGSTQYPWAFPAIYARKPAWILRILVFLANGFCGSKCGARAGTSPLQRRFCAWLCGVSGKSCLSAASSFARRKAKCKSGKPKAAVVGALFFAYFLWQDKESKLLPGNPRQNFRGTRFASKHHTSARRFHPHPALSRQGRGD
jgi:hypothetical protein